MVTRMVPPPATVALLRRTWGRRALPVMLAPLLLAQTIGCERASDRLPDSRDWRCYVVPVPSAYGGPGLSQGEWTSVRTSWDAERPYEVEALLGDRFLGYCHPVLLTRRVFP